MKTKYKVYPEFDPVRRKEICKLNTKCVKREGKGCKCITIPIDEYASFNCVFLALSALDVKMRPLSEVVRRYKIYEHDNEYFICPNHIRQKFYEYLIAQGHDEKWAFGHLYEYKDGIKRNTRLGTSILPYVADFYHANILFTIPKDRSFEPIMYRGSYKCTFILKHDNDKHVNAGLFLPDDAIMDAKQCDLFALKKMSGGKDDPEVSMMTVSLVPLISIIGLVMFAT